MSSGPALWWYFAGLLVVMPPIVLAHELGHAVAARKLLPGRVLVHVGTLRRGLSFRTAGIEFLLTPVLVPFGRGGTCLYEGRPSRREATVIALSGPAATLLGFVATMPLLAHTTGPVHSLVWIAVLAQGGTGLLNLVPFALRDRRGRTTFVSDGMSALRALRAG
jgi:hypothetical protein